MKTILHLRDYDKYELEIHAENDLEAIALQAWSERYFVKDNNQDEKQKAFLLITLDIEKK